MVCENAENVQKSLVLKRKNIFSDNNRFLVVTLTAIFALIGMKSSQRLFKHCKYSIRYALFIGV